MIKKIGLSLLFISILFGAYFFVRPFYRLPFDKVSVFYAVAESNSLLLACSDLNKDPSDWNKQQLWYLDAKRLLELLDTTQLKALVEWEEWWIIPQTGDGPLDATYTFIGSAKSGLAKAWNPQKYGPTVAFNEGEIYTFGIASDDPMYFARYHNLLIAGRYPFQIESALLAAQGKISSWHDNKDFVALAELAENRAAGEEQLFLYPRQLSESLSADWIDQEAVRYLSQQAEWVWLGADMIGDSLAQFSSLCVRNENLIALHKDAAAWDQVPEVVQHAWPIVETTQRQTEEEASGFSWMGTGAWQMVLNSGQARQRLAPHVWVFPIADTMGYRQFREQFLGNGQLLEKQQYQLFDVWQLQNGTAFSSLTDRKNWQPWIVELPEALIVSVFQEDIERYLDYYLLGGSISKQSDFLTLKKSLPVRDGTESQGYFCWGPLTDQETNLFQLLFPAYEWSRNGCMIFEGSKLKPRIWEFSAAIQTGPKASAKPELRWTLPLAASGPPQCFPVQTLPEGFADEAMVQDENGHVWLLNAEGEVIWEDYALPALYQGITKVRDAGNQWQWIAASSQGLHIWNAAGERAKIAELSSRPSAGASCFRFRQNDPVAIAFPTEDGTIELLDISGRPLSGWPVTLAGKAISRTPVVHWQLESKDLLIAQTEAGSWQLLDRFGSLETSLPAIPEQIVGKPGMQLNAENNGKGNMLLATPSGKVYASELDGSTSVLTLGRGPLDNFLFTNIWGDNRGDFVAQRGSLVHVFAFENDDGLKERWQQRLPLAPDTLIAAPPIGLLTMQFQDKKIWLIDQDGAVINGFPLSGESGAFLGGNDIDGFYLITILDAQVYRYDLNITAY